MQRNNDLITELILSDIGGSKNSAPFDLKRLLYKGGAGTRLNLVDSSIRSGALGSALHQRFELVKRIHNAIADKLAGGGSSETAKTQFNQLCNFFKWAEGTNHHLDLDSVQASYIHWTDYLLHRQNVEKSLRQSSAYTSGRVVGQILDDALGRETPVVELTRLKEPRRRNSALGIKAEKQSLTSTFAFGRLLQDICDGLPLSAIWGPRPVRIPLQNSGELVKSCGPGIKTTHYVARTPERARQRLANEVRRIAVYEESRLPASRAPLINLRILSELLMFIGQTGMNLAQAYALQLRKFSYSSDIDGYKVREYKPRRGGEVLFEIFKEYRSHFERYLEWRRALFPNENRLFPLIRNRGVHERARPYFGLIQQACKHAGVAWHPPSVLRSTRVNWLLRRSGDPDLTAEIAQHHKQTLLRTYAKPSLHRSIGEFPRFWQKADPALLKLQPLIAVAPGVCSGTPLVVPFKPKFASSPDCVRPSGCLWCEHHRDIDSFDYVWALACFRHLKTLELSTAYPPAGTNHTDQPSHFSVSRISEKLTWFRNSNAIRKGWVDEALTRVDEGRYHPEWLLLIEAIEGHPA